MLIQQVVLFIRMVMKENHNLKNLALKSNSKRLSKQTRMQKKKIIRSKTNKFYRQQYRGVRNSLLTNTTKWLICLIRGSPLIFTLVPHFLWFPVQPGIIWIRAWNCAVFWIERNFCYLWISSLNLLLSLESLIVAYYSFKSCSIIVLFR